MHLVFSHSSWVGDSKSWVWWTQGTWTSVEQKFLTVKNEKLSWQPKSGFISVLGLLHTQKNLLPSPVLSVWKLQSRSVFVAAMMGPDFSRSPWLIYWPARWWHNSQAFRNSSEVPCLKLHGCETPQWLGALLASRCCTDFQPRTQCGAGGQPKLDLVL